MEVIRRLVRRGHSSTTIVSRPLSWSVRWFDFAAQDDTTTPGTTPRAEETVVQVVSNRSDSRKAKLAKKYQRTPIAFYQVGLLFSNFRCIIWGLWNYSVFSFDNFNRTYWFFPDRIGHNPFLTKLNELINWLINFVLFYFYFTSIHIYLYIYTSKTTCFTIWRKWK